MDRSPLAEAWIHTQPEPNWPTPPSTNLARSWARPPKLSTAVASEPAGLPPPVFMAFQKKPWFQACPALLNSLAFAVSPFAARTAASMSG